MERFELTAPCMFGLEAVLKDELKKLNYSIVKVVDGRVTFEGDALAICRSNLWLRTAERVLIDIAEFKATTFDELFEQIKALPWEKYIPKDGKFWVKKASSIKSKLFSPRDIQSIVKKAMVERLKTAHNIAMISETGNEYPVRIFINKDIVSVSLDTSGDALYKRGYRQATTKAPIRETLAAALVLLSPWRPDRVLVDPFCGSGTIPIEAAMIGLNMAPGMNREFQAESWENLVPKKLWMEAADEAQKAIRKDIELNIQGFDMDYKVIQIARENAANAFVDEFIHFQDRPVKELSTKRHYGVIVTNPPYGERLEDQESIKPLYQEMGEVFLKMEDWSYTIITSFDEFQRYFGRQATKNRKLYNGMLKTYIYQYLGPKPPYRSL
ncbi:MAG: class I SAM-dependent RNA methyltransferase [Vallitaleaceae bacterium]|nr:class I SAM-dependent RNA methyltransferase [Vallitaleaceae bacterium]